jgi:hypothetical protein
MYQPAKLPLVRLCAVDFSLQVKAIRQAVELERPLEL